VLRPISATLLVFFLGLACESSGGADGQCGRLVGAGRIGGWDGVFELNLLVRGGATVFAGHAGSILALESDFKVVPGADNWCAKFMIFWRGWGVSKFTTPR
jgi:hypothetical protein